MRLVYRNDFDVQSTAGMAETDDYIEVDSAPSGGDFTPSNGETLPITLIPPTGDPIHTRATSIDGTTISLDYTAPADIAGPIRVICAPTAQTMDSLRSIACGVQSSPYDLSHTVHAGIYNDIIVSGYSGNGHTLTLTDPLAEADFVDNPYTLANRTTILCRCDVDSITLSFTPPSGYTFRWDDGVPAPETGKLKVLIDLTILGVDIFGSYRVFA